MQPRIIAELGINHQGLETIARALIDAAAHAGVWGIKFQYRNLVNTYATGSRQIGDEILHKEITENFLSPEKLVELGFYAQSLGLKAGISFFTPMDIEDFGSKANVFDFFKVPSVEFTNTALIKRIEVFDKIGFISTGSYAESVIIKTLENLDRKRWTPLHCVSNYPVAITSPKLGYIKHLQHLWGGHVGYSSHDDHWETCLLAAQLGASVIERHITLDKNSKGLDHTSSSNPDEFKRLAIFMKNIGLQLAGDGPRIPNQGELLNLQNLGKSFYASNEISKNQPVTMDKLQLRTPRTGLGQEEVDKYLGQPAVRHVKAGEVIDRSVFEQFAHPTNEVLSFAIDNKVSIPVRFHDLAAMKEKFPIGRYEFHLSFGDICSLIDTSSLDHTDRYSIHLPDYVSSTLLLDPFSPDKEQKSQSISIIDRTADFADKLQQLTSCEVPIVGSFSMLHTNLDDFYSQHTELLEKYQGRGVLILPQWLPPVAWYFGGAVRLNAMNNVADIAHIKAENLPICMDICHLCMGDKVFDFTAADVVENLAPQIRHVHIADARGYDGEGLPFGRGDLENMDAIRAVMSLDCVKVIEVWQGHLHGGSGFAKALLDLKELFDGHK